MHTTAPLFSAIAAAAVLVTGCGATGDTTTPASSVASSSTTTATDTPSTTAVAPGTPHNAACDELPADTITAATGEPVTDTTTYDTSCTRTSDHWTVTIDVHPTTAPTIEQTVPPGFTTIAGITTPHAHQINLERGGRWHTLTLIDAGEHTYTLNITNNTAGSDTYPPADAPPQHDPTNTVAAQLVAALTT